MTISRLRHYRYVVDIAAMVPDHLEEVWNDLQPSLRTALESIVLDNTEHYGIEADVRVDDTGEAPAWGTAGLRRALNLDGEGPR